MNDVIMAAFQLGACFFLALSIRELCRDRVLKGVSIWMIAFFSFWTLYGTWNWFVLGQHWSFATSVIMGLLYLTWLSLAITLRMKR